MNCKRFILLIFILISQYAIAQTAFWRVEPTYDQMEVLNENLLKVKVGDLYGVVKYDGTEIVPCVYSHITSFAEDRALLLNDNRLKGLLDAEGKIITLRDEYVVNLNTPYFSEGFLAVKNDQGVWGYLDRAGELRIACRYVEAYPFKYGLAAVAQIYRGQKYHMHISTSADVCLLGNGYNDDYLVFTSTFTSSSEGPFAIVVNTNKKISKRSLDGTKLADLGTVIAFDRESKEIVLKGEKYYLNDDWSLKKVVGSDGRLKFEHKPDNNPVYSPSVSSLKYSSGPSGKLDLRVMNKIVLSDQFDSVIPLTQALCAVSLSGKYGILDIYPTDNLALSMADASIEVSHHVPVTLEFNINTLSSLFKNFRLENAVVTLSSGYEVRGVIDGGVISFDYLPTQNGDFTETFKVSFMISGLSYPELQFTSDFSYSSAFRIAWPTANVSLDSGHNAVFDITVINRSSTVSDESEIFIDGKSYGKFVFKPNEKKIIQVSKLVDIQDEDSISKTINVVIRENGCPDYRDSRKIVFERYFIN